MFSVRFAHLNGRYNRECRSRLIADGFAFSFGQHESVGRSLAFRVSAYSQNRLVGKEIQQIEIKIKSDLRNLDNIRKFSDFIRN